MSSSGLTPGDPLSGGGAEPQRERPTAPPRDPGLWSAPETVQAPTPAPSHYTSPPPPGAGGGIPAAFAPVAGRHQLSGWWRRAIAAVIDAVIIGVISLAIMAPLGIGAFAVDSGAGVFALIAAFVVAALVASVVALLYAPVLMSRTNGQTLGRMATGIRVVRTSGAPMTFGWAMLREVAVTWILIYTIGGSVTFGLAPLLDILWPLWDEENRALHDFPVETRTVLA